MKIRLNLIKQIYNFPVGVCRELAPSERFSISSTCQKVALRKQGRIDWHIDE